MNDPAFLIAGLAVIFALVMLAWAVVERGRAERAAARLDAALELQRQAEAAAAAQREILAAQSERTAAAVAETLVKRAQETFAAQDRLAQAKLDAQLKPVSETLEKFAAHVAAVEQQRAADTGGLKAQIEQLLAASAATQDEARKLSAALRRGAGVQGRWGEQMLRNVLELAGLRHRTDFEEQVSTEGEGGRLRPDVVVRLPGGGAFVIDAKCSLTAYLEAQEALDETGREAGFARHAQSLRGHVTGLSAKAYWDQFEASPDFVAMFVPGDGILAAALERAPELMSEAMERRVILVTPTTLFALCKAVAYGWRVEKQALNAAEIAALGRELYKRLSTMGTHAAATGKALENAVAKYNQMVGSLESQVLTQARRFEDLQVDHEGKKLPELSAVEGGVRQLSKLATEPALPSAAE